MNPSRLFREVLESHEFRLSDTDSDFSWLFGMSPSIFFYVR